MESGDQAQAPQILGKVDVVLLTRNSKDYLEEHIGSAIENMPIHKLIVVDAGSTDGTIDSLEKKLSRSLRVVDDRGKRATLLQRGIEALINEVPAVMSCACN